MFTIRGGSISILKRSVSVHFRLLNVVSRQAYAVDCVIRPVAPSSEIDVELYGKRMESLRRTIEDATRS
jgi:hypothetical protein